VKSFSSPSLAGDLGKFVVRSVVQVWSIDAASFRCDLRPTKKVPAMIDAQSEQLIPLTQAAKSLPGRPHVATLWRWRTAGLRGIRLETLLCGGRRMTSREALARFFARVTSAADGQQTDPPTSEASDYQRAVAQLTDDGLLPRKNSYPPTGAKTQNEAE
jgi:hypothetical protein